MLAISNGVVDADIASWPVDASDVDRDAEFAFAINSKGKSYDPHRPVSQSTAVIQMNPVYDRLVSFDAADEGVEIVAQLALAWKTSADGLAITFELRDDVTFQDGTTFDGEAVRANIERAKDPDSTVSSLLSTVDDVEVVSPTEVIFHLNTPNPALLYSLAKDTIGLMASPAAFDSDLATTPVGSGPFVLVSDSDSGSLYERWDGHWDPDAALVERLEIANVADANARINGLRTGGFDAVYAQGAETQAADLADEGYKYVFRPDGRSYGIIVNTKVPPFDDVRVRRAIWMLIDRELISEELTAGLAPPMFQPFAPGAVGHDPALDVDPYDPDAARTLLEEAGVEGTTLTLLSLPQDPYGSIGLVLQQALEDVGVDVEIVNVDPSSYFATWQGGSYGFVAGSLTGELEPSLTLTKSYLGGLALAPAPPELVEMATAALALAPGSDEQTEAYQEIGRFLVENPIHIPVVQAFSIVSADRDVIGAENILAMATDTLDFRRVGIAK